MAPSEAAPSAPPWHRDRVLACALAVGLALRLGALLRYPHLTGLGDEILHYIMGRFVELYGTGPLGQWAPAYDVGLGLLFRAFGPDPFVPKLAQVLLSTASLVGVYALGRRAGDLRAGRIAVWLCALDPSLIAFTHYLYTETLFIACLLAAACALFVPEGPRSRRSLILGGLAFGAATLTRSVGFYFLLLWSALAFARGRRGEAREAAIVFVITLAVVAPWTVRNFVKYDAFLLVDGTLGRTSYLAFSERFFNYDLGYASGAPQRPLRAECQPGEATGAPALPSDEVLLELVDPSRVGLTPTREAARVPVWRARRFAVEDLAAVQRCEVPRAIAFARENPVTVVSHAAQRFYAFWGPNSYLLRAMAGDVYAEGPLARSSYPIAKTVVVVLHVLVLLGAILTFGRRSLPPLVAWIGLFVVYYTAVHVLAVAYSRYRLPLMPLLTILAAVSLARPRRPEGHARSAAVALGLLLTLAIGLHYTLTRLP